MTATVYAVWVRQRWQWRATLDERTDAAYWQSQPGGDHPILWTGVSLSWGQAARWRDRLIRSGWTPPDRFHSGIDSEDEEQRRELTIRAAEAGIPEPMRSGIRLQICTGMGKQPSLEQNEPDVRRLAAAIRGRSLFRDELLSLCAERGIDVSGERWRTLAQAAELRGWLAIRCGVEDEEPSAAPATEPGWKRRLLRAGRRHPDRQPSGATPKLVCRRCGAGEDELRFAPCPSCGGLCAYCQRCLGMGRSRMCEPLFEAGPVSGVDCGARGGSGRVEPVRGAAADMTGLDECSPGGLTAAWGLSPAQAEASAAALRFLRQSEGAPSASRDFLIWAVTGAGKTEMVFPLLADERRRGGRTLVATPRKDVVLELLPRLKAAFPGETVIALYGGSEERWADAGITLGTTHQLLRFRSAFDLVILDEIDAFPYAGDPMLTYAAEKALAPVGRRILLSATPPRELEKQAARGQLPHAKVPVRYHRHPLPVPWLVRIPPLAKWVGGGRTGRLPRALKRLLDRSLAREAQVFVFVPEIRLVEPLAALLGQCYPDRSVSGTSSKDEERMEKVADFRKRRYDLLVTTTILERGVTVPRTDVFVLDADASWFGEAALIQMAGRAGRSKDDPAGYVVFAAESVTRNQTGAVRQIRRMNRLARQSGFLLPSPPKGRGKE